MVLKEPRRYAQIGEMPQTHMRRLQAQGCRLLTPMEDRQASDRSDSCTLLVNISEKIKAESRGKISLAKF